MKKKILSFIIAILFIIPYIPMMNGVQAATIDPEYETPKHGIPVLYINIDESKGTIDAMNKSKDHSVNCYGSVDIKSPAGYKSEYTGKEVQDVTGLELEYMRGRGNSSWSMNDKKPYKLKFKKGVDLFGMGKNKHWVLLANRYDNSFMRNKMTYWLGTQLGLEFTPQSVPVEVVMNGDYYGLYFLTEQIRVGESRVNIDDLEDEDTGGPSVTEGEELTGGYLLSMEYGGDESTEHNAFATERDVNFFLEALNF